MLDPEGLLDIAQLTSFCAGLVTIDEQRQVLTLVHPTTQEYFSTRQKEFFPSAHGEIATACITYLSFNVFESGLCQTDSDYFDRLRLNPFYSYATLYWGHHARTASAEKVPLIVQFLESENKVSSSYQSILAGED